MNGVVYHGNSVSREMIRAFEFYYDDDVKPRKQGPFKWNVLITTYEMLIADMNVFAPIPWQYVVVDEAHRLKNKVRDNQPPQLSQTSSTQHSS